MRSLPAFKQWLAVVLPVSLSVTMISAAAASTLTITTASLAGGVDGTAYSQQLTSTGGTGKVTWKLANDSSLVAGLGLSTSGLVSGTPTASTNGPGNFTVVATDSASPANTATAVIPYIINPSSGGGGPTFYLAGLNQGFGVEANDGVGFFLLENQTVPSGGFKLSNFSGGYSDGSLWYSFVQQKAQSGEIASNGAGGITGTFDQNQAGQIAVDQTGSATYTATTTGRFVQLDGFNPKSALYFVSPNKAYAVNINGSTWSPLEEINHQ